MNLVRKDAAPAYEAPGHFAMAMRYLQGREAGPSDTLWIGLSVIEPGGGTSSSASTVEKFYVVLEGELEIAAEQGGERQAELLHVLDSCRIAPGEARQLTNRSERRASVLLVMPRMP